MVCERFGVVEYCSNPLKPRYFGRKPAVQLRTGRPRREWISVGARAAPGGCATSGRSYYELSGDCGLSVHWVRLIERAALDKLRSIFGPCRRPWSLKARSKTQADDKILRAQKTGLRRAISTRFPVAFDRPSGGLCRAPGPRAAFDRQGFVCRGEDIGLGQGFAGTTLAGWFDDDERLIAQASRLHGVSGYVAINPVRLDLLARSDNRLSRVRHTTRDADIVCIRWLYLDIDPQRPPEISSTDAEVAAALKRRDAILNDHPELAATAAWGCSGNGAWILIRLPDYPNDPEHATVLRKRSLFSIASIATTWYGSTRPLPIHRDSLACPVPSKPKDAIAPNGHGGASPSTASARPYQPDQNLHVPRRFLLLNGRNVRRIKACP